ncbi:protein rep [Leptotrichia sp. oral taxon 223]|uniref:protein rep n=1 Tax=Leptotrichia sp. oral taxon 223 TaxID=712363 RepID=UPI0015BFBB7E|nr:protein rep [Leptotrichia sp. oral taxon 223]NWO18673.1 protein rep [Leptotrichia sp. oral taxon 223]
MEKSGNYPKRYRYTEKETDRIIEILEIIEEYRKTNEVDEIIDCINNELLYSAGEINFVTRCKRQTCPLCRENKKFKSFLKLKKKINEQNGIRYILITFNGREISDLSKLSKEVGENNEIVAKIIRKRSIQAIMLGYIKIVEISYNKYTGKLLPHIHLLLGVREDFKKHWIRKKEIEKLEKTWKKWKGEEIKNAIDVKIVKDTENDIDTVLKYITIVGKKRIMKLDDMEIRAFFEMINDRKRLFTASGIFK